MGVSTFWGDLDGMVVGGWCRYDGSFVKRVVKRGHTPKVLIRS